MKINIEFDDELKNCIDAINDGKGKPVITNTDQTYTIEFKASDIGIANAFIYELFKSKDNTLCNELGIKGLKLYRGSLSELNILGILGDIKNENRI